jgi:hypothetical protein
MSKKVILYVGDYFCSDIKRRREINMVVNANSQLEIIEKIVILFEKWDELPPDLKQKDYSWISRNNKIEVINSPKHQTYADFFKHSLQYPDNIIIISNSDIVFDHTLNRINELEFSSKKLYAITRWDLANKHENIWITPIQSRLDMNWSYDCYIFSHPIDINFDTININIGIGGCDTYLVKKIITDNLIKVENPVYDIRCWHKDYRIVENIRKPYMDKQNYNVLPDYPGGNRDFSGVVSFGGQIGLKMEQIGCYPVLSHRYIIRKGLKVISFSLWGNNEKYTKGAILNAELALEIYPEWVCWFYIHKDSVPNDIVEKLLEFPNVNIIFIELTLATSMRFRSIDNPNVDMMLVRDCDSQLSKREKICVDQWLKSDKRLHIIRDHPHHCNPTGHRIMAGMFGMKKAPYWIGWDKIFERYLQYDGKWGLDQDMLQQEVYPLFSKYCDIMVHATFNRLESFAIDIPVSYDEKYTFIGEQLYHDGTRHEEHNTILKEALKNQPKIKQCEILKIDTCLVSCLQNDRRIDFYPIVRTAWQNLCSVRCMLIIVGDTIPEKLQKYSEDIILFPSLHDIDPSFQANIAPLLYASTFHNSDGIIVSLLELFPLRKTYFDIAKRFDNDRFVIYKNVGMNDTHFLLYYNVASPKVWKEIFGIQSINDINIKIRELFAKGTCPKSLLHFYVCKWNENNGGRLILMDDIYTNFNRLVGEVENESLDKYTDLLLN